MLAAGHAELRQPVGVASDQPPRFYPKTLNGKIDPMWIGGVYGASSSAWSTTRPQVLEDCGLADLDYEGLTKQFIDVRADHQTVGINVIMDRTVLCTDRDNMIQYLMPGLHGVDMRVHNAQNPEPLDVRTYLPAT